MLDALLMVGTWSRDKAVQYCPAPRLCCRQSSSGISFVNCLVSRHLWQISRRLVAADQRFGTQLQGSADLQITQQQQVVPFASHVSADETRNLGRWAQGCMSVKETKPRRQEKASLSAPTDRAKLAGCSVACHALRARPLLIAVNPAALHCRLAAPALPFTTRKV